MSFSIVCLPTSVPDPSLAYDYLRATDTVESMDRGSVSLALLSQALAGDDVLLLVPRGLLSWHAVTLPKGIGRNSSRLRTVLDSLLEDRLLDDPGQLHLAIGQSAFTDVNKADMHWVAACDKAWLHSHLNALESAGVTVTRIVPEFVPTNNATEMHVVGTADQPLLVATGRSVGGVCSLPFSTATLAFLPRIQTDAEQEAQTVFAEPAVVALVERFLPASVSLKSRDARWLEASRTDWNMAQFDLASTGRTRILKRIVNAGRGLLHAPLWRYARWSLLVLLLANLVGLNALAWKEKSALHAQRQTMQNMLTQTFPQVKLVVNAPLQMQREVAALRQATGASSAFGLESALNAIGTMGLQDRTLNAIDMTNGEIRFKGLALSPQELSGLSASLNVKGFAAVGEGDVLLIKPLTQKGATP